MSRLRNVGLVAGFDLYESLRSLKALALILIYVLIAFGATALFSQAVNGLFEEVTEKLGPQAADKLLESDEMLELVTKLTGNEADARELLRIPFIALFYQGVIVTFMPLIMVLTSSDAISGQIASGAARFSLFRTDRASWALGKLVGQAALMMVGILVGALVCWGTGMALLDRIDAANALYWLLRMSFRGAFYGFAYLGIALCASQLVRTNFAARGIALAIAMGCFVAGRIFTSMRVRALMDQGKDLTPEELDNYLGVWGVLGKLVPSGHAGALIKPDVAERAGGMLGLLLIGLAFFGLGFWRLYRRDA